MAVDNALIKQAQTGDANAFQQLLETHYDMIYRIAYKFSGHTEDAADIAQEVCMRMVDRLASFRAESSFSTWLYRITVNAYYDFCKKQRTQRNMQTAYSEYEKNDQADQQDSKQKTAWLYRAINSLEPTLKETVLLVLSEGLSHAEAGKILNCAESTISWRMHEARKMLSAQARSGT